MRMLTLSIVLAVVAAAGCASPTPTATPRLSTAATSVEPSAPPATVGPSVSPVASGIDPAEFVGGIDNPWFPLVPGTVLTYKGTKDGEAAVDVVEITGVTKVIDGVTCEEIHDTLTLAGALAEKTSDWYVQDRFGNVWYFGEQTAEYDEQGKVASTEGTWQAGVDGARPGIYMPGQPEVGQSFQQEFYTGQAEDRFVVLLLSADVKVPYGAFKGALLTAEWTPLEPDVLSEKAYISGIGEVSERDITGGDESLQLVKVTRPSAP